MDPSSTSVGLQLAANAGYYDRMWKCNSLKRKNSCSTEFSSQTGLKPCSGRPEDFANPLPVFPFLLYLMCMLSLTDGISMKLPGFTPYFCVLLWFGLFLMVSVFHTFPGPLDSSNLPIIFPPLLLHPSHSVACIYPHSPSRGWDTHVFQRMKTSEIHKSTESHTAWVKSHEYVHWTSADSSLLFL